MTAYRNGTQKVPHAPGGAAIPPQAAPLWLLSRWVRFPMAEFHVHEAMQHVSPHPASFSVTFGTSLCHRKCQRFLPFHSQAGSRCHLCCCSAIVLLLLFWAGVARAWTRLCEHTFLLLLGKYLGVGPVTGWIYGQPLKNLPAFWRGGAPHTPTCSERVSGLLRRCPPAPWPLQWLCRAPASAVSEHFPDGWRQWALSHRLTGLSCACFGIVCLHYWV